MDTTSPSKKTTRMNNQENGMVREKNRNSQGAMNNNGNVSRVLRVPARLMTSCPKEEVLRRSIPSIDRLVKLVVVQMG